MDELTFDAGKFKMLSQNIA